MHRFAAALTLTALLLMPAPSASAGDREVQGALGAEATTTPAPEAPGTPEVGGVGIRLVDIPAATQTDPRARSYIVDNLPPGTTIERRIEVQNSTGETRSVSVYPGPASIEDGSFTGAERREQNDLSRWTSVDRPELELAAGASEQVLVTVAVPTDAPEGEQYAAVWAEIRSTATADAPIVRASRAGIRMYVSVGPGNGPAADFTIDSLTADRTGDGVPSVTATVTNTGGRALDVSGELSLSGGPSGLSAGPFTSGTSTTLAPGDTETLVVPTGTDLPDGPWTARLELTSGLVVHEISAELTFPEAGGSTEVAVEETGIPPSVVVAIVAGVLLLLAGAAFLLLRRRRTGDSVE
jgi:hypothetical protein